MSRASLFVPLGVFGLILLVGFVGFKLADPHQLPSALLGKPFPEFDAVLLKDPDRRMTRQELVGEPILVNVWATWCPTCLAEHEQLLAIRRTTNLRIVGVNYKDDPIKAIDWLARYGDPYDFNLLDIDGALGVELGVYGAPETFLLDATGTIVYKRVGEITQAIWQDDIQPLLATLEVE
jgi:cytochrome c biogenesis protein CcmG/thiol:disulfide interchange protein DsbE